ncbi:MAG: DNA polymerase III subunit delta [Bacilli bacterium]|nr:DNA polymerase III subunit delta [Bacilli bacterium]
MNSYLISSFSLRLLYDEIDKITANSNNIIKINMDEITINDLINECSYYSLLNDVKYVVVNNFKLSSDNNKIINYLKDPHPNTVLILITDKIDKRSIIYKEIVKSGKLIIVEDVKNLNQKINVYCQKKDIKIDFKAVNKLLENNLNNYDLVLNEIDKISIATNNITLDEVIKYTFKLIGEDNFTFCDVVIKKDYPKIITHFNEFKQLKQEVIPFVALLASQYRLMYAVKSLNETPDKIAKELGVHPYRVKLAKEKSYMYSKEELQKKLLDLCDLDYNLKTSMVDKYMLLKIFLVNV